MTIQVPLSSVRIVAVGYLSGRSNVLPFSYSSIRVHSWPMMPQQANNAANSRNRKGHFDDGLAHGAAAHRIEHPGAITGVVDVKPSSMSDTAGSPSRPGKCVGYRFWFLRCDHQLTSLHDSGIDGAYLGFVRRPTVICSL